MKLSTILPALSLALVACGGPPGEEESATQGIATSDPFGDYDVDIGRGVTRPMRVQFGSTCVEWDWRDVPKSDKSQMKCLKWQRDDSVWMSAKIYKDNHGRDNDRVFPAARGCGSECVLWSTEPLPNKPSVEVKRCIKTEYKCGGQVYRGCGVAAAANVLNFYGVELGTHDVAPYIETINFPFTDNIGSTPDALASGLERLLNEKADGHFTVTRKSYTDVRREVWAAIRKGTPIILLVNNGGHYQVVTGYENWSKMSVTDYVGFETKVEDHELKMANISGDVLGWAGGYLPYTVITIERRPR